MHFAPPLVHFCAYSPDVTAAHLESIKYVMIGAAPVGEALANKFKEKAPNCQFREGKFISWPLRHTSLLYESSNLLGFIRGHVTWKYSGRSNEEKKSNKYLLDLPVAVLMSHNVIMTFCIMQIICFITWEAIFWMSIDQLSKELRKSRFRIRHYQQLSGPNESSSVRFLSFSV